MLDNILQFDLKVALTYYCKFNFGQTSVCQVEHNSKPNRYTPATNLTPEEHRVLYMKCALLCWFQSGHQLLLDTIDLL